MVYIRSGFNLACNALLTEFDPHVQQKIAILQIYNLIKIKRII